MSNEPGTRLFFVTVCDSGNTQVEHLSRSLHGNLIVLDTYDREIGGVSKLTSLREFLDSATSMGSQDVVVFLDGLDVLCVNSDSSGILSEFRKMKCDIVFAAENRFSHQLVSVKNFYDERGAEFRMRYLNSGFFVGYVHAVREMLAWILDHYPLDMKHHLPSKPIVGRYHDQTLVSRFMWENAQRGGHLRLNLDYGSRLVFTYTQDNLDVPFDKVRGYFVHVCWLKNPANRRKYESILRVIERRRDVSPIGSVPTGT